MRLNINGNELEVEVFGADDAPVLIAHHGAPGLGSRSEPRATFSPFADTFRVIVFDARGSGVSEGNGPFSHEQWVADVDGLREWAGVERFVMAGGSYGGFISMEYAIRHPERVRALVLRDTSADHENDKAARHNAETSTRVTIDLEKLDRINTGQTRDDADLRDCWQEILPLYDHVYDPAKVAERVEATPIATRRTTTRSRSTCRTTTSSRSCTGSPARPWSPSAGTTGSRRWRAVR